MNFETARQRRRATPWIVASSALATIGWVTWMTALMSSTGVEDSNVPLWVAIPVGVALLGWPAWLAIAPGVSELVGRPWRRPWLAVSAVAQLVTGVILSLLGGAWMLVTGALAGVAWLKGGGDDGPC